MAIEKLGQGQLRTMAQISNADVIRDDLQLLSILIEKFNLCKAA
jgi:hypothetical protein